GKIMQRIKLVNTHDEEMVRRGLARPEEVRAVEIEALVDTGATMLMLPADVVAQLGLPEEGRRPVCYANGQVGELPWVGGIRITILGREAIASALVGNPGTTALIGQLQLEELDLIVDPKSRELRVNPRSPDAPLIDLLTAA